MAPLNSATVIRRGWLMIIVVAIIALLTGWGYATIARSRVLATLGRGALTLYWFGSTIESRVQTGIYKRGYEIAFVPNNTILPEIDDDRNSRWIVIPIWIPIGAMAIVLILLHRKNPNACRSCGYELSGLPPSGACPECGRGVSSTKQQRET